MQAIDTIFTEEQLAYLRSLPEVTQAYEKLSTQNTVSFSVPVSPTIKQALYQSFGIDLFSVNSLPFRWIKGDTAPHSDRGQADFDSTYLVYLTDGDGQFILGEESYPIEAGTGFSFSEGLSHSVIGTNGTSRLLLGPMSEQGFAVGAATTITANGLTETIFFSYQSGTGLTYTINAGDPQSVSLPITIVNSNTSYTLKVLFETDITIESAILFFICGSDNIQFGSTSLEDNGMPRVFTIDSVTNYPGLIQNGTVSTPGNSNIYVYNIQVITSNESTLAEGGGWIGHAHFSKEVTNNYIVNCSSTGDVADYGGGIVGQATGGNIGGSLVLRGCSSSGTIGTYAGGIAGYYAGESYGSITCENCWSEGAIGGEGGGIFGGYAGVNRGVALAENCYSTGSIGAGGGGICGSYAGESIGQATVQNCYSRGDIQTGGGGIFGANAGDIVAGVANVSNSYSAGSVTTPGTGIYGSNKLNGNQSNCYAAGGSWSDVTASTTLQGVPGASGVGTKWISRGLNQPYELNGIGYTPYSTTIINSSSELVQSFSETVNAGATGSQAILADASGNDFTILQVTGGDSGSYTTITMSSQTGAISTTTATVPGTYTITLRSIGSYNITIYILLVTQASTPSTTTSTTCCQSETLVRDISYEWMNDYKIGRRLIVNVSQNPKLQFNDYSEYIKYKMALGSGKI